MSHATVMVLGPKTEAELDAVLAPFNEEIQVEPYFDPSSEYVLNSRQEGESLEELAARLTKEWEEEFEVRDGVLGSLSTYNPASRWDWYVVGGRWRGMLPLRDGATGLMGEPGTGGKDEDRMRPGGVDVARLGDIDFHTMRAEAERGAMARWDEAKEALDENGGFLPRLPAKNSDRDTWQAWWKHHTVKAVMEAMGNPWSLQPTDLVSMFEDRERYVRRCGTEAILCFATVTPEGEWLEPGKMGWFGSSTDDGESRESYGEEVSKLLTSLPEDTRVWIIDFHI